jgi:hypothetical protein
MYAIHLTPCNDCGAIVLNDEARECPRCGEKLVEMLAMSAKPGAYLLDNQLFDRDGRRLMEAKRRLPLQTEHTAVWLYCFAHLRPHKNGWCKAKAADEHHMPLKAKTRDEAQKECAAKGLKIEQDWMPGQV